MFGTPWSSEDGIEVTNRPGLTDQVGSRLDWAWGQVAGQACGSKTCDFHSVRFPRVVMRLYVVFGYEYI